MNIAVITGASSGLGKVFYEKVMERYKALDEVWLIARREDRLKELADKYPDKKVRVLPYLNLEKETVKAMKKAEKGAAVYTPLAFYKAYRVFGKIVPSALAVKFTSVESGVTKD